jgi:hypothetical protein
MDAITVAEIGLDMMWFGAGAMLARRYNDVIGIGTYSVGLFLVCGSIAIFKKNRA